MGHYLNPGSAGFTAVLNNDIYVDKTELIAFMNQQIDAGRGLVCHTRPRRFGKTVAVMMLSAYYSHGASSATLFEKLAVVHSRAADSETAHRQNIEDFRRHLNQYDVISWDIIKFMYYACDAPHQLCSVMAQRTMAELMEAFPDVAPDRELTLLERLEAVSQKTGRKFIVLIDEWDALLRETTDEALLAQYFAFLQGLFGSEASARCIAGAYLTGILPVPRIDGRPALCGFNEISMLASKPLADCIGFTETEVRRICRERQLEFGEMRCWYEGYRTGGAEPIYNPVTVLLAAEFRTFDAYWAATESEEALRRLIELPVDGLAEAVLHLLQGDSLSVCTQEFSGVPWDVRSRDDVLTLLIHYGYLGFEASDSRVFLPNKDAKCAFLQAIRRSSVAVFRAEQRRREAMRQRQEREERRKRWEMQSWTA